MARHRFWRGDHHTSAAALAVAGRGHEALLRQGAVVGADQLYLEHAAVRRCHDHYLHRSDDLGIGAATAGHHAGTQRRLADAPHAIGESLSGVDRAPYRSTLAVDRRHGETAIQPIAPGAA